MAALMNPKQSNLLTQEQNDAFAPLLKTLTSPSRLSPSEKGKSTKLVCVLISLAELAECAPSVFHGSTRGQKAIQFALEMVLLGRAQATIDDEGESDDSNDEVEKPEAQSPGLEACNRRRKTKSTTPAASKKSGVVKHSSPGTNVGILEDESLSVSCRTLCAAIEFLVAYIRHSTVSLRDSTLASRQAAMLPVGKKDNTQGLGHTTHGSKEKTPGSNAAVGAVSEKLIGSVFDILTQILHDQGLPPSAQDRRDCKLRQDRAALRQCSAIHLLRLCDPRLSLEHKFLIPSKWHMLAGAFLDDERVVRDKVMEEYGFMLTGQGKYKGSSGATAPSLRMLSLVTLCTDGDHGMGPSAANGNAANVGKRSTSTKMNATNSIESLRKIYELSAAQHRALGVRGEERFETQMKVMLMPEYMVPYAFHVLAFRRETPGASASKSTGLTEISGEDEPYQVDDGQHRILRKRLKWLFDPLIHSLGESADNISLLIRMTEIMEKKFQPQDLSRGSGRKRLDLAAPIPSFGLSPGSDDGEEARQQVDDVVEELTQLATAKLKIICTAAREVLLSHVKKDVNLTTYPGQIQLPADLFRRVPSMRRTAPLLLGTESTHRRTVARLPQKSVDEILADDSTKKVSSATSTSTQDKGSRRNSKRAQGVPNGGVDSLDRNDDSMELNKPTTQSANENSEFPRPANRKVLSTRSSSDSAPSSTFESVARRLRSARDSFESVDDPRTIVPPPRNGMANSSAHRNSLNDAASFHNSEGEPHSRGQIRSSIALNSSQESNQSSHRSRRSGVSPGSRSSRVHFSPEVSTRNIPAQSMESSVHEGSPFGGGEDLSPIRMVGSPLPQSGPAGTGFLGSGEKTCGTTPPSFLRGATMTGTTSFDCSTDQESSASDKSENQIVTEPLDDSTAYHSDGDMEQDEGDGTKTTSETQSTEDPSHNGTTTQNPTAKKRASPGKENQSHKRHKTSVPTQIKVSRNKPAGAVLFPITSSGPAMASRSTRKTARSSARATSMSSNEDSLDFDGGLSGEDAKAAKNTTAARGRAIGGNSGKGGNKTVATKKQGSKAKEKPVVSRQRRRRA
jgi:hypothetical protein